MKCPNCGEEIPAGKKFCGFCGAEITEKKAVQKRQPEPLSEEKKPPFFKQKWFFWLIGITLMSGLIVLLWVFGLKPQNRASADLPTRVADSQPAQTQKPINISQPVNMESTEISRISVAGIWSGEIGNETWSAIIEVVIDEFCEVGAICGSYRLLDYESTGNLELVNISDGEYRFFEHPEIEENIEGDGYQIMSLIDDKTMAWSFEQELTSDGSLSQASGILLRSE